MQTLCQSDQAAHLALQGNLHEISDLLMLKLSINSPPEVRLNLTRGE